MTQDNKIAKAGTLVCVSMGKYDDYEVNGFFVVLRDFYPMAELASHLAEHPEQRERFQFEQENFLQTLLAKGLLMKVDYGNLFLGGDLSCDEFSFAPAV